MENAHEIQSKYHDNQSCHKIQDHCVFPQQLPNRSHEGAHDKKDNGETQDKADGIGKRFSFIDPACCETGNIDRQHRQKTRRYKSNDSFQKQHNILHTRPPCLQAPIILFPGRAVDSVKLPAPSDQPAQYIQLLIHKPAAPKHQVVIYRPESAACSCISDRLCPWPVRSQASPALPRRSPEESG